MAPPATHPHCPRHPPTSVIDSRRRFQQHTRNQAPQLNFEFFSPNLSTLLTLSYLEIVFAVLEHFWWRKHCQKRGGKWDCNRRRETIIGSQVQVMMPKGA